MGNSIRWTTEQLEEYRKRAESSGGVRTHALEGSAAARKPAEPKAPPKESKLERRFLQQLADAGIENYVRNYFPILGRDWELDFAWPPKKVAVEVDGMAHRTRERFKADFQKHAALILDGWLVIRVCGDDVRQGRAIEWTKRLLA